MSDNTLLLLPTKARVSPLTAPSKTWIASDAAPSPREIADPGSIFYPGKRIIVFQKLSIYQSYGQYIWLRTVSETPKLSSACSKVSLSRLVCLPGVNLRGYVDEQAWHSVSPLTSLGFGGISHFNILLWRCEVTPWLSKRIRCGARSFYCLERNCSRWADPGAAAAPIWYFLGPHQSHYA